MLMDGNIRGYQDKNCLCVQREWLGTLDDEQVEATEGRGGSSSARAAEDVDMEDGAGIPLWDKEQSCCDGMGETCRTLL